MYKGTIMYTNILAKNSIKPFISDAPSFPFQTCVFLVFFCY